MASELVPVEQVDRDAAGDLAEQQQGWFSIGGNDIAAIRHGSWDKCNDDLGVIVQSFARHRLAALDAQASRIAELEAGIKLAAVWFEEYALLHRAKGTAEGNDKGQRNQDRADQLRALLGDREG